MKLIFILCFIAAASAQDGFRLQVRPAHLKFIPETTEIPTGEDFGYYDDYYHGGETKTDRVPFGVLAAPHPAATTVPTPPALTLNHPFKPSVHNRGDPYPNPLESNWTVEADVGFGKFDFRRVFSISLSQEELAERFANASGQGGVMAHNRFGLNTRIFL